MYYLLAEDCRVGVLVLACSWRVFPSGADIEMTGRWDAPFIRSEGLGTRRGWLVEQSGKGISGRASSESSGVTPRDIRHKDKFSYNTKAKWPPFCPSLSVLNTLRLEQMAAISLTTFLNEFFNETCYTCILLQISLNFVPMDPIRQHWLR